MKLLGALLVVSASTEPVEAVARRALGHGGRVGGSAATLSIHQVGDVPSNCVVQAALIVLRVVSVDRNALQSLPVDWAQPLKTLRSISSLQPNDGCLKRRTHET
eukprot:754313-Hanusia_phi.AAC.2